MFCMIMNLRMFIIKIKNYGDLILYFVKLGNIKDIFDFCLYDPVNML